MRLLPSSADFKNVSAFFKMEEDADEEAAKITSLPRPRRSMGLGYILEDAQWLDDDLNGWTNTFEFKILNWCVHNFLKIWIDWVNNKVVFCSICYLAFYMGIGMFLIYILDVRSCCAAAVGECNMIVVYNMILKMQMRNGVKNKNKYVPYIVVLKGCMRLLVLVCFAFRSLLPHTLCCFFI